MVLFCLNRENSEILTVPVHLKVKQFQYKLSYQLLFRYHNPNVFKLVINITSLNETQIFI